MLQVERTALNNPTLERHPRGCFVRGSVQHKVAPSPACRWLFRCLLRAPVSISETEPAADEGGTKMWGPYRTSRFKIPSPSPSATVGLGGQLCCWCLRCPPESQQSWLTARGAWLGDVPWRLADGSSLRPLLALFHLSRQKVAQTTGPPLRTRVPLLVCVWDCFL